MTGRLLTTVVLIAFQSMAAAAPVTQTYMVEMSDGVKLATDVYWPENGTPPYPAILIRTPYNKDSARGMIATTFCNAGFAVVAQDMRGRFKSEGHHAIIFGNEGLGEHRDGHDTMNWITRQRWSDKKIVTWGGSAVGIVQNQAAPGAPEALVGQVVQVAFSSYYHQAAYQGGVWRKNLLEKWLQGTGMVEKNQETFAAHPYYDDFWKSLDAERFAEKVNAPALFAGGWYDIFAQGTINSFTTIQEKGGPNARGKCFLVMAPIAHGPFTVPMNYPRATASPIHPMAPLDLIAYWARGEHQDKFQTLKPVHYYVMGDVTDPAAPGNFWRAADHWPPPADLVPFHLHADKSLRRDTRPDSSDAITYKYDPANPVPTLGGQELFDPKGPVNLRPNESRSDVLVFTTEALAEPLEVTGRITARLYISSDCPDTDFTVALADVYPDGRAMLVTDGIQRASLRNSFEKPEFLEAGKIYELNVDLWSTSLIFNKGHRIRIHVSSSNSPRFEPNANTGDPHPTSGKMRTATNTVHVSRDHASHILLPIYRGAVQ